MTDEKIKELWIKFYKEFEKIYIKELGQEQWNTLTEEMKYKAFKTTMKDIHTAIMAM